MTRLAPFALVSLFGCAVDSREVEVNGVCVDPPADGVIADFSEAGPRPCPAGFCEADLVGIQSVTLGEGQFSGIVVPYVRGGVFPIDLGTNAPMPADAETPDNELWAVLDSGAVTDPGFGADTVADGFALRFVDCVDTTGYSALSFEAVPQGDSIATCQLDFAIEFVPPEPATLGEARPLRETRNTESVSVAPGTVTLEFGSSGQRSPYTALGGMQWEFSVPADSPAGCSGYLTIDDIRLVR